MLYIEINKKVGLSYGGYIPEYNTCTFHIPL